MDGKRRLSSDGKTQKPANKSTKMAEQKQECSRVKNNSSDSPDNTMVCKLTVIAEAVQNLQEGQRSLQSLLESKLDKFRNEFMSSIDEKFKAMRSDIDLELAIHKNEIDQLSRSVDSVIQRLNDLEENSGHQMSAGNSQSNSPNDDPSLTVIAMNVQETEEPILDVAREIVSHMDNSATVVAASRLRGRYGKPGLVKISFSSLEEKKNVLREKRNIRNVEKYKTVSIRSSKSYTERLIELNARTMLSELPHGNQFRITSNGRIVKKTPSTQRERGDEKISHDG